MHLFLQAGPFVDVNHPAIQSGKVTKTMVAEDGESTTVSLSFAEVFGEAQRVIGDALIGDAALAKLRVVLLPSLDDAHVVPVLPQPPLDVADLDDLDTGRVLSLSNPCTFKANGIVVGVSTTDTFKHMAQGGTFK